MNDSDRHARIHQLHNHRHTLLQQRDRRGATIATIDMELNVVRSELQALYEAGRTVGADGAGSRRGKLAIQPSRSRL